MNQNQLSSPLKAKLLDMLSWFHDFCVEHQLRYYVLGGTLLGAVRHKGFIPWDDDIDVGMPRADYLRLETLMKQHTGRYILETPNTDQKDFYYPFTKLYDTQTTLVENTRFKIKRGIYLDIFPLDGAGESAEEAREFFAPIHAKRNLLLTLTTGIRKGRSFYKNASVALMRIIPDWVLSKKKVLHTVDTMAQQKDYDQCRWVGNLMGNWMERELVPRSFLGTPTAYPFETLTVYGPEDYEGYLTSIYGNWRELPPPEKQKPHHDFVLCDLEHSYLDA